MNAPDKCPRCGAAVRIQLSSVREYECRSYDDMIGFHQTSICLSRDVEHLTAERDALSARVKELEAYAERLIGAGDRSADLLSCSMGLDETDEWANTHGAHKTRIASDAIADWEKAKEAKP